MNVYTSNGIVSMSSLPQNRISEYWITIILKVSDLVMKKFLFDMPNNYADVYNAHHDRIVNSVVYELYAREYKGTITDEISIETLSACGTVIVNVNDDFIEEVLRTM